MPLFLADLARRAAQEVERALSSLLTQDDRTEPQENTAEEIARLKAESAAHRERADRLERQLTEQRGELASLVAELNDRVLPGVDERIHETERDLTRLATRMLRADQDSTRLRSRLDTAEQRIGDLRERAGRLEQRTGLWRELQANVARLGEELDALRARSRPRRMETGIEANLKTDLKTDLKTELKTDQAGKTNGQEVHP
jgi:hypothetical protein